MRTSFLPLLIFILSFLGISCGSNQTSEQARFGITEGMNLLYTSPLPFEEELTEAVAKVYLGNSFNGSGAFVSSSGLFVTNFSPVLEYFAEQSDAPKYKLENGFSAKSTAQELPLRNVSLLIEIEQLDVTERLQAQIPEGSSNRQISAIKQQVAQTIIDETKEAYPDAVVLINEVYSGNNQMLSIYQAVRDVRLVFAPALNLTENDLTDSDKLNTEISGHTVLLRGYVGADGSAIGYAPNNIPFEPTTALALSKEFPESGDYYALGFPDRTFRLDSYKAFNFYTTDTNPYILSTYTPYLEKENRLAASDLTYAYRSLPDRYYTAHLMESYRSIQKAFKEDDLLGTKASLEFQLRNWIETDSAANATYRDIFSFIEQAFDIADQNGAGFYATSYILSLSKLDEIASIFKNHFENDASNTSHTELLEQQKTALSSIVVQEELELLKDFLLVLQSLPEDQQILSVQTLFENIPEEQWSAQSNAFIQRMAQSSFLVQPEKTPQVLEYESFMMDSLYVLMDEIIFINEVTRNNQAIYLSYLQPARQVLVEAKKDFYGLSTIHPDANGTLRYNRAYFDKTRKNYSDRHARIYTDFSGRAPGSAIITPNGTLLGIASDEVSQNVAANYVYDASKAELKVLPSAYFYSLLEANGMEAILNELADY